MQLENRHYRMIIRKDGLKCEQVTQEQAAKDFDYAARQRIQVCFTIRNFANGVSFLLYSPHVRFSRLKKQADYMAAQVAV